MRRLEVSDESGERVMGTVIVRDRKRTTRKIATTLSIASFLAIACYVLQEERTPIDTASALAASGAVILFIWRVFTSQTEIDE